MVLADFLSILCGDFETYTVALSVTKEAEAFEIRIIPARTIVWASHVSHTRKKAPAIWDWDVIAGASSGGIQADRPQ